MGNLAIAMPKVADGLTFGGKQSSARYGADEEVAPQKTLDHRFNDTAECLVQDVGCSNLIFFVLGNIVPRGFGGWHEGNTLAL